VKLLERLIRLQGSRSDREFARLLGVAHTTWSDTRKGKQPIRYEVLAGAVSAFREEDPALEEDVIDYLAASRSEGEGAPLVAAS
jgi:hypothetical protein